jgi:ABC-type nitrate/sulfonate/bicarbonate transport system ATPase subunit
MIRATGIHVRFGDVTALRLDDLSIGKGERLGIQGPNGSGKTTLLRVLAGLLEPTEGTVEGAPEPGRIVLVHQRPHLFRGTARDNVTCALGLCGRSEDEATALLEQLGAPACAERPASAISGGERRGVAIARAMAVRPAVLLLDEPFAALDEEGLAAVTRVLGVFEGTLVIAAPDLTAARVDRVFAL